MIKVLLLFTLIISNTYAQVSGQANVGKWRFNFQYSFGTSNEALQRNYIAPDEREIELRTIIDTAASDYTDHQQRLSYLKSSCQGLSEIDKIRMARYLSDRMSDIYDYDRINGGPNSDEVVTTENQWSAFHNLLNSNGGRTDWGVCRDMTSTVSEFLLTCGLDKKQIAIESYRSSGGGHQILQIFGSDGQTYTVNWSELYSAEESAGVNTTLDPNITRVGIEHTRYDAETGRVIDMRQTELGMILAAVTHGRVDDPDYLPNMLLMEASYGVMTANVFKSNTARGELVRGISLVYEQSQIKWLHIGTGITYANSQVAGLNRGAYSARDLDQNIIFFHFKGTVDLPELQFFKKENSRLYMRNVINFDSQHAYLSNKVNGGAADANYDQNQQASIESSIMFQNNKVNAQLTTGYVMGINKKWYNNEVAHLPNQGYFIAPFSKAFLVNAQITLDAGKLQILTGGQSYFYSYGVSSHLMAGVTIPKQKMMIETKYLNNTLNNGVSLHQLLINANKTFTGKRGSQYNLGLEYGQDLGTGVYNPTFGATLNITPNWGKKKKKKR